MRRFSMKKQLLLLVILFFLTSCVQQRLQTEQDIQQEITQGERQQPQEQELSYSLFEWGIEPQTTHVKAGMIKFLASNDGKDFHAFKIEGNGIEKEVGILKGEVETLEVTLPAGTYTIYCSVPGHREKGMEATFIVE